MLKTFVMWALVVFFVVLVGFVAPYFDSRIRDQCSASNGDRAALRQFLSQAATLRERLAQSEKMRDHAAYLLDLEVAEEYRSLRAALPERAC